MQQTAFINQIRDVVMSNFIRRLGDTIDEFMNDNPEERYALNDEVTVENYGNGMFNVTNVSGEQIEALDKLLHTLKATLGPDAVRYYDGNDTDDTVRGCLARLIHNTLATSVDKALDKISAEEGCELLNKSVHLFTEDDLPEFDALMDKLKLNVKPLINSECEAAFNALEE